MTKPIRSSLKALTTTFENLFRKPTCYDYPFKKRERAERFRTSFALLHDEAGDQLCIGCKKCENICPSRVIKVVGEKKESPVTGKKRGYSADFTLDMEACIFCELCVQVCPEDAIRMCRVAEQPAYAREDLCLTMDKLYANETRLPASWSIGSKLIAMHEPPKPPAPPPAPAAAAPAAPAAPAVKEPNP